MDKENINPQPRARASSVAARQAFSQSSGQSSASSNSTSIAARPRSSSSITPQTLTAPCTSALDKFINERSLVLKSMPCECHGSFVCEDHGVLEDVKELLNEHLSLVAKDKTYRNKTSPTCQLKTFGIVDESGALIGLDFAPYITLLHSEGYLSRMAKNVVLNAGGHKSHAYGGGGGTLSYDVKTSSFAGRPAFDPSIIKNMSITATQHRRHIIAWHHIREFASVCHRCTSATKLLKERLASLETSSEIFERAKKVAEKCNSDIAPWVQALYLMNSCKENLWPGSAKINMSINSNYHAIKRSIQHMRNPTKVQRVLEDWSKAGAKSNARLLFERAKAYDTKNTQPLQDSSSSSSASSHNIDETPEMKLIRDVTHKMNTNKVYKVGLIAELEEYGEGWALTSLKYDVPLKDVDSEVITAIEVITKVAINGNSEGCEQAGLVFNALLPRIASSQPPAGGTASSSSH